ncbi:ComE operon protein 1 [compost metagenome]
MQKELNGIGKAKAEAIVAYREANGPFASVDELLEIKGIGNALLERNRDKVMVE